MQPADRKLLKVGACVRVHWDDITYESNGWTSPEGKVLVPDPCVSVGYVLKLAPKFVQLAMTHSQLGTPEAQYLVAVAIPLGCINRVEVWK